MKYIVVLALQAVANQALPLPSLDAGLSLRRLAPPPPREDMLVWEGRGIGQQGAANSQRGPPQPSLRWLRAKEGEERRLAGPRRRPSSSSSSSSVPGRAAGRRLPAGPNQQQVAQRGDEAQRAQVAQHEAAQRAQVAQHHPNPQVVAARPHQRVELEMGTIRQARERITESEQRHNSLYNANRRRNYNRAGRTRRKKAQEEALHLEQELKLFPKWEPAVRSDMKMKIQELQLEAKHAIPDRMFEQLEFLENAVFAYEGMTMIPPPGLVADFETVLHAVTDYAAATTEREANAARRSFDTVAWRHTEIEAALAADRQLLQREYDARLAQINTTLQARGGREVPRELFEEWQFFNETMHRLDFLHERNTVVSHGVSLEEGGVRADVLDAAEKVMRIINAHDGPDTQHAIQQRMRERRAREGVRNERRVRKEAKRAGSQRRAETVKTKVSPPLEPAPPLPEEAWTIQELFEDLNALKPGAHKGVVGEILEAVNEAIDVYLLATTKADIEANIDHTLTSALKKKKPQHTRVLEDWKTQAMVPLLERQLELNRNATRGGRLIPEELWEHLFSLEEAIMVTPRSKTRRAARRQADQLWAEMEESSHTFLGLEPWVPTEPRLRDFIPGIHRD